MSTKVSSAQLYIVGNWVQPEKLAFSAAILIMFTPHGSANGTHMPMV